MKTWIMIDFGAQNDPEKGPLQPIFNTFLKVAQIDMDTKNDVKPMANFWEKDKRSEFLIILCPLWQKIGPLRPIFPTHLKVLAMSM